MIFDYSKKIKIALVIILAILIIVLVWFCIYDRSRVKDLRVVNQAQTLATALEQYYDRFNAYPQISEIDANSIKLISDHGLNKSGELVYYRLQEEFVRPVTLLSSGTDYVINFELKNKWPVWQLINSGGECNLATNMLMICKSAK